MEKLLRIGITSDRQEFEKKLIKNVNLSAVVLALFSLALSCFFLFVSPKHIVFGLIFLIPPVFSLALNAINSTILSRIVFVVFTDLLLCISHAYFVLPGEPPLIYLLVAQFTLLLMVAVLFDTREIVYASITILILAAIFFSFPFLNDFLNLTEGLDFLRSRFSNFTGFLVDILIAIGAMSYLQSEKFQSGREYANAREELKEKDKALEKQEEELQKTIAEISETHKQDDKRSWIATGIHQLNNILRNSGDENVYGKVINSIIRYLKTNQGAIYEVEENEFGERFFAVRAAYGFEKNRLQTKRIPVDDKGFLGQSYREKAPVYRVELPSDYTIESGLGETRPGSLFIVPMVYEDNIEGMLELASFRKLEDYEKEYILKVSDILARFIESYQASSQSKDLLERTNQQTEEMRAQEEEMRQNMEELQATQEELHRKEREYLARIDDLEKRLKS